MSQPGVIGCVCIASGMAPTFLSLRAHAGMLGGTIGRMSGQASMSFQSRDSTFRTRHHRACRCVVGLRRTGKLDDAAKMLLDGAVVLFGPLWDSLSRRDSSSAAILLGSRERISAYAMFVQHEAEIEELRGHVRKARDGFRRALEVHLEAARLGSEIDAVTRSALRTLKPRVDLDQLPKAYRIQLDRIVGPT